MKDNWEIMKLSDICDVRDGTHDSPKYYDTGIPLITSKNLMENMIDFDNVNLIQISDHKKISERSFVEKGDILFGMIGTVGKPVIVDVDFEFSIKNVALLKFSKAINFINTYAIQVLKSSIISEQFKRKSDGGVQSFISLSTIRNLDFPLPPLPQQQKIAKILSTCDEVIEKTEAAIAKYKAIKQGMIQDLFTRGIDVSTGKLRPSYQEAPELYKESELGMIPKEWEVKRLEELTQKISDGIHTTPKYIEDSAYHFINGNNLNNGVIEINSSTNCVSYEEYLNHKQELSTNTILYSINGTIGKIAIYKQEKVVLGKSAAYFCFSDSELMKFIYYSLQTEQIKKNYDTELTGSTIKNLSINSLRNTLIKLPSNEEFIKITNRITSFDEKLQSEESSLSKYKKLKEGLMQDLLTGKVEVSE